MKKQFSQCLTKILVQDVDMLVFVFIIIECKRMDRDGAILWIIRETNLLLLGR